jgi:exportin-2 (importin alpha re-exporter)
LEIVQAPLLTLFQKIGQAVEALSSNAAELVPRFAALRSICRIFYSLNYQDLPEFFEDHMQEWMIEFGKYLQYRNPVLEDDSEETQPSPIDRLQAAIIDCLFLYADKDEEPFIPFLPDFTTMVWNLLMGATAYPKHDMLATTSIKFLSSLIEKLMHKHLFEDEATLRQIVARIVIPNIFIREIDQENFEDDPREFILTEMEGSDNESRRRCSQVLLHSMCRHFEAQTTAVCLEHIGIMLNEFMADPANKWTSKDAAVSETMIASA